MLEHHAARPSSLKRASLVLAGAAVLAVAWTQREWLSARAGSGVREEQFTQVGPDTFVRNTDTVLVAVRSLARLESVAFHMERVIDLKEEHPHAFGMVRTQDTILLVAAGDVVAGVDLSKMQPDDVMVKPYERRVQLRVPPAEILSVGLDEKRTYVHSRRTTVLTKPALDLEARARQQAVGSIREAALQAGILERAHQTASQTLRALLLSLGYEVDFIEHE
jgi:hypothetical protein